MLDILDTILAYLGSVSSYGNDVRMTLAGLARTCRAFQDPGLNGLRKSQTGLALALRCFPDDLWDRSNGSEKLTFTGLKRPLVLADWERPLLYWNRIQCFYIHSFDPEEISPAVCETLRMCCPTQHLFPTLREIKWFDEDPFRLSIFAIFLSPQVRRIGLFPGHSMAHLSVLPSLGIKYPDLAELDFRGIYRESCGPLFLKSVLALLSNLPHLEWLGIPNIDALILDRLARLRSLKTLVVDVPSVPEFSVDVNGSTRRSQALEELCLWSTTPEIAIAIIEPVSHPLREIGLRIESEFPDAQMTARLYSAIRVNANRSCGTMKSLHMEDEWAESRAETPSDDEFDSYVVESKVLETLFLFINLIKIILQPYHGFDLDDEMVSRMARAWSRVEELRMIFSADLHIAEVLTRTTLLGIHTIAMHCLNLHTLELYFDASAIPALVFSDPLPESHCRVPIEFLQGSVGKKSGSSWRQLV
ncbi:hypothetical protein DFH08DRAFT_1033961 [Mycena albidolilacea]|uniref:Uncharacterized protein n=1 Tax=Mycena albidolilacea TaxID=1033008 RepID=A0AAD6ZH81_9AGAR|nr:hypothetical protein DFH08DRAFT_1033961 [Mycena albidolilacea]